MTKSWGTTSKEPIFDLICEAYKRRAEDDVEGVGKFGGHTLER